MQSRIMLKYNMTKTPGIIDYIRANWILPMIFLICNLIVFALLVYMMNGIPFEYIVGLSAIYWFSALFSGFMFIWYEYTNSGDKK